MNSLNKNLQTSEKAYRYTNNIEIKGGKSLEGNIKISGAKNSALVLMASSILSRGQINLFNAPEIADVEKMSNLLIAMGIDIQSDSNKLKINPENIIQPPEDLSFELYQALRASFFCIGPILARFGKAKIPLPGGCSIGARPIDEHINSLAKLGVEFKFKDKHVIAEVINSNKRLK